MKQKLAGPSVGFVVLLWALAPGTAFAYIDPGNGAYMVQAAFTVIGAAVFYLRHPIRSLFAMKEWLAMRFRRGTISEGPALIDRTQPDD